MNKFKYMTESEIEEYRSQLEAELLTSSPERLKEIDKELTDIAAALAKDEYRRTVGAGPRQQRTAGPIGQMQILGTYGIGTGITNNTNTRGNEPVNGNVYGSSEYRQAFMGFVLTGARSEILEYRANATTLTSDIGTVIPTTIVQKVYEKMSAYSMIWDRITKTNVKGGVSVPTSSLKPTATWVAEGSVSDKQKKPTGSITFNYYKLQCRVAISLEASTVSLEMFESTVVENIYEAMIIAVEQSVVTGTGVGQPLGIVNDNTIPAGQIIDVTAAEISTYGKWAAIIGTIPLAYEAKVNLTLTKKIGTSILPVWLMPTGNP